MKHLIILLGVTFLSACHPTNPNIIINKPTHCPMHYQPVCATLKQDEQIFQKTFGNHCSAQTFIPDNTKVLHITNGECS